MRKGGNGRIVRARLQSCRGAVPFPIQVFARSRVSSACLWNAMYFELCAFGDCTAVPLVPLRPFPMSPSFLAAERTKPGKGRRKGEKRRNVRRQGLRPLESFGHPAGSKNIASLRSGNCTDYVNIFHLIFPCPSPAGGAKGKRSVPSAFSPFRRLSFHSMQRRGEPYLGCGSSGTPIR